MADLRDRDSFSSLSEEEIAAAAASMLEESGVGAGSGVPSASAQKGFLRNAWDATTGPLRGLAGVTGTPIAQALRLAMPEQYAKAAAELAESEKDKAGIDVFNEAAALPGAGDVLTAGWDPDSTTGRVGKTVSTLAGNILGDPTSYVGVGLLGKVPRLAKALGASNKVVKGTIKATRALEGLGTAGATGRAIGAGKVGRAALTLPFSPLVGVSYAPELIEGVGSGVENTYEALKAGRYGEAAASGVGAMLTAGLGALVANGTLTEAQAVKVAERGLADKVEPGKAARQTAEEIKEKVRAMREERARARAAAGEAPVAEAGETVVTPPPVAPAGTPGVAGVPPGAAPTTPEGVVVTPPPESPTLNPVAAAAAEAPPPPPLSPKAQAVMALADQGLMTRAQVMAALGLPPKRQKGAGDSVPAILAKHLGEEEAARVMAELDVVQGKGFQRKPKPTSGVAPQAEAPPAAGAAAPTTPASAAATVADSSARPKGWVDADLAKPGNREAALASIDMIAQKRGKTPDQVTKVDVAEEAKAAMPIREGEDPKAHARRLTDYRAILYRVLEQEKKARVDAAAAAAQQAELEGLVGGPSASLVRPVTGGASPPTDTRIEKAPDGRDIEHTPDGLRSVYLKSGFVVQADPGRYDGWVVMKDGDAWTDGVSYEKAIQEADRLARSGGVSASLVKPVVSITPNLAAKAKAEALANPPAKVADEDLKGEGAGEFRTMPGTPRDLRGERNVVATGLIGEERPKPTGIVSTEPGPTPTPRPTMTLTELQEARAELDQIRDVLSDPDIMDDATRMELAQELEPRQLELEEAIQDTLKRGVQRVLPPESKGKRKVEPPQVQGPNAVPPDAPREVPRRPIRDLSMGDATDEHGKPIRALVGTMLPTGVDDGPIRRTRERGTADDLGRAGEARGQQIAEQYDRANANDDLSSQRLEEIVGNLREYMGSGSSSAPNRGPGPRSGLGRMLPISTKPMKERAVPLSNAILKKAEEEGLTHEDVRARSREWFGVEPEEMAPEQMSLFFSLMDLRSLYFKETHDGVRATAPVTDVSPAEIKRRLDERTRGPEYGNLPRRIDREQAAIALRRLTGATGDEADLAPWIARAAEEKKASDEVEIEEGRTSDKSRPSIQFQYDPRSPAGQIQASFPKKQIRAGREDDLQETMLRWVRDLSRDDERHLREAEIRSQAHRLQRESSEAWQDLQARLEKGDETAVKEALTYTEATLARMKKIEGDGRKRYESAQRRRLLLTNPQALGLKVPAGSTLDAVVGSELARLLNSDLRRRTSNYITREAAPIRGATVAEREEMAGAKADKETATVADNEYDVAELMRGGLNDQDAARLASQTLDHVTQTEEGTKYKVDFEARPAQVTDPKLWLEYVSTTPDVRRGHLESLAAMSQAEKGKRGATFQYKDELTQMARDLGVTLRKDLPTDRKILAVAKAINKEMTASASSKLLTHQAVDARAAAWSAAEMKGHLIGDTGTRVVDLEGDTGSVNPREVAAAVAPLASRLQKAVADFANILGIKARLGGFTISPQLGGVILRESGDGTVYLNPLHARLVAADEVAAEGQLKGAAAAREIDRRTATNIVDTLVHELAHTEARHSEIVGDIPFSEAYGRLVRELSHHYGALIRDLADDMEGIRKQTDKFMPGYTDALADVDAKALAAEEARNVGRAGDVAGAGEGGAAAQGNRPRGGARGPDGGSGRGVQPGGAVSGRDAQAGARAGATPFADAGAAAEGAAGAGGDGGGRGGDVGVDRDANFQRWFGDSKVVDEEGKPLQVYHGTGANVKAFNPARAGENTEHSTSHLGFFFTEDADIANLYTPKSQSSAPGRPWWEKAPGPGANIMPVHLSIKNPYEMSAIDYVREFVRGPEGYGKTKADRVAAVKAFQAELRAQGYDGVHIKGNEALAENLGGDEFAKDSWVAFDPTQIKSSTGNSGAFDPKNPDVSASLTTYIDSLRKGHQSTLDLETAKLIASRFAAQMGRWSTDPEVAKTYLKELEAIKVLPEDLKSLLRKAGPGESIDIGRRISKLAEEAMSDEQREQAALLLLAHNHMQARATPMTQDQVDAAARRLLDTYNIDEFIDKVKLKGLRNPAEWALADGIVGLFTKEVDEATANVRTAAITLEAAELSKKGLETAKVAHEDAMGRLAQSILRRDNAIFTVLPESTNVARMLAFRRSIVHPLQAGEHFKARYLGMLRSSGIKKEQQEAFYEMFMDTVQGKADPSEFAMAFRRAIQPKWFDKFLEFWKAGLLGLPTQMVNIASNAAFLGLTNIEKGVSNLANVGYSELRGKEPTRFLSETNARAMGGQYGFAEAWQALKGDLFDIAKLQPVDVARRFDMNSFHDDPNLAQLYGTIGGKWGEFVRIPFKLLDAFDGFFKHIIRNQEWAAQADRLAKDERFRSPGEKPSHATARIYAELRSLAHNPLGHQALWMKKDPKTGAYVYRNAIKAGRDMAIRDTFQEPLIGTPMRQVANSWGKSTQAVPALQLVTPFVKTPYNILAEALKRTPMAGLWAMQQWARGKIDDPAMIEATVKSAIGTAIMAQTFSMAMDGTITGSGPADPKEAELLKRRGWGPRSIKIGDKYYPYSRFAPFSIQLGLAADMADAYLKKDVATGSELFEKGIQSASANITDQSFLTGIDNLMKLLTDPKRQGATVARQFQASLVPNVVGVVPFGQAARAMDPKYRETEALTMSPFLANIPGMSESLPAQRSATGEERMRPGSPLERLISPSIGTPVRTDPIAQASGEIARVGPAIESTPLFYRVGTDKVYYSPQEREAIGQAQQRALERVARLMQTSSYQRLPDTMDVATAGEKTKKQAIEEVLNQVRRPVVERMNKQALRRAKLEDRG